MKEMAVHKEKMITMLANFNEDRLQKKKGNSNLIWGWSLKKHNGTKSLIAITQKGWGKDKG